LDGGDIDMISDPEYDSSDDYNNIGMSTAPSPSIQLQQTAKQDRNENGWNEDDDGLHFDDDALSMTSSL
jgi:hypothetical protein